MDVEQRKSEERLLRQLMYTIGTVVIVLFLTVGSCTMHSNAYEPEVEAEHTEQIKADTALEEARLKALKALIDSGVNPLAARCAVKGWKGETAGNLCERAAQEK